MKSNPLTESMFYILLALSSQPLHGYGIIKKVELLSDGRLVLAAGTLYGAIENLKKSGLIDQVHAEQVTRRKNYQITDHGRQVLENDFIRIKSMFFTAEKILRKGEE